MVRRIVICSTAYCSFCLPCSFAEAQQAGKVPRIGFLESEHCFR